MASIRAIGHVLSKKHILTCSTPSSYFCHSFHNSSLLKQSTAQPERKSITKTDNNHADNKVQVNMGEVVKEATKSATYLTVILAGLGVTGYILYVVLKELLSSNTPNGIYSRALNQCLKDTRVLDALGEPIKAYGEENRRGRRQHVSHGYYMKGGVKHIRMKFHIKGSRKQGSVLLEAKETKSGDYEYTYLYVLVDDVVRTVIKIEDNRSKEEEYFFGHDE